MKFGYTLNESESSRGNSSLVVHHGACECKNEHSDALSLVSNLCERGFL